MEVKKTESKELVKADEKWLKENARLGMEDITAADLPIPQMILVQKADSKYMVNNVSVKPGLFYHTAKADAMDVVECKLLSVKKAKEVQYSARLKPAETLKADDYKDIFVFIGVRDVDEQPFLLKVRGASMNSARNFLATVLASKKPLLHFKVKLESKFIEGQMGPFYVLVFRTIGEETDSSKDVMFMNLATKYSGVTTETDEEEITKVEDVAPREDDSPF